MQAEGEEFNWAWIAARRDRSMELGATTTLAPASWRQWLKGGPNSLERCRRRVVRRRIAAAADQMPTRGSREEIVLNSIYARYSYRRTSFENLASFVVARYLRRHRISYTEGWVTPQGADEGVDFVGRIDMGIEVARTQLVVLGQAKCERPTTATNGNHVARTVARLKRGWVGAYVTTSYFSPQVQREVAHDEYPIFLLNGLDVAKELISTATEEGCSTVTDLLDRIDEGYASMIARRRPGEVINDDSLGTGLRVAPVEFLKKSQTKVGKSKTRSP